MLFYSNYCKILKYLNTYLIYFTVFIICIFLLFPKRKQQQKHCIKNVYKQFVFFI